MNIFRLASALAMSGPFLISVALAQTPERPAAVGEGATNPSSSSRPHQRGSTTSAGTEAPPTGRPDPSDAASPHQQEAMKNGQGRMASAGAAGAISPAAFVKKAAQDGMTEVELGKLALQKSESEDVRAFADRMVKDHGKANAELASIASSRNDPAPKALDAEHQAMITELQGTSGMAFDAAYAQKMMEAHGKAIALFKEAATSSDADIASFARKTLPTLQEHQKMANDLESSIATASTDARKGAVAR